MGMLLVRRIKLKWSCYPKQSGRFKYNPYQIIHDIYHKTETKKNPKIYMELQKDLELAKSNPEEKEQQET